MSDISDLDGPELYLSLCRKRIRDWEQAPVSSRTEREAAEAFTRAFAELDAALSDGHRLPLAWAKAKDALISSNSPDGAGIDDPPGRSYLQERFGSHEVRLPKPPGEGIQ